MDCSGRNAHFGKQSHHELGGCSLSCSSFSVNRRTLSFDVKAVQTFCPLHLIGSQCRSPEIRIAREFICQEEKVFCSFFWIVSGEPLPFFKRRRFVKTRIF